jgi:hypothetical protein
MAYEDLREKGYLEEVKPNFSLVSALMARAAKDLATAKQVAAFDREWAYAIAYQGMLRAGRGVLASEGLRTRGREQQRTTVAVIAAILGEEGRGLANAFDRMRRRWQMILEEPGQPISRYEAEGAVADAQLFINRMIDWARTKNPQLTLL